MQVIINNKNESTNAVFLFCIDLQALLSNTDKSRQMVNWADYSLIFTNFLGVGNFISSYLTK